jgi:hypothetical protein
MPVVSIHTPAASPQKEVHQSRDDGADKRDFYVLMYSDILSFGGIASIALAVPYYKLKPPRVGQSEHRLPAAGHFVNWQNRE